MGQPAENQNYEAPEAVEAPALDPHLIGLMKQSEALVSSMRDFFQRLDRNMYSEFRTIAAYIAKARDEITALQPNNLSRERIPSAGAELEAITRDTETATNTIMNSAEAILGMDADDLATYRAKVENEVMIIFEACSFQDITGQRVSKVVNVLRQIEARVGRLANSLGVEDAQAELSAEEKRKRDLLLNGPAVNGPETGQDDIDALFNGQPSSLSGQDDIDAMFDAPAGQDDIDAMFDAPAGQDDIDAMFDAPAVAAPVPAPEPKPVPKPEPKPEPKPAPKAEAKPAATPAPNSQSDIDSLFDAPADPGKPASQDDIDALFD